MYVLTEIELHHFPTFFPLPRTSQPHSCYNHSHVHSTLKLIASLWLTMCVCVCVGGASAVNDMQVQTA